MVPPILPTSTPQTKARVVWVDYAKGLSIFLVVVYHVWNGIMKRPDVIPSPREWYEPINRTFEMVRMPLFFFVSGLFIGRSAQKATGKFVIDKLGAIVWPYLIWSVIHVLVTLGLSYLIGNDPETTLSELPRALAIEPVAQFWFLYVLFMALMLFFCLVKLRVPTWGIAIIGFLLVLVQWNIDLRFIGVQTDDVHYSIAYWGPMHQLFMFFIYMALGAILAPPLLKHLDRKPTWGLLLTSIIGMAMVIGAVTQFNIKRDSVMWARGVDLPVGAIFALISVASALSFAVLLQRAKIAGFVRIMGQFSLYIFVMHVMFAAGVRTGLLKAGVIDFWIHLLVGLAVGILTPIGVGLLAKRFNFTWLFTLRPG